jgi:hypothetical protein
MNGKVGRIVFTRWLDEIVGPATDGREVPWS